MKFNDVIIKAYVYIKSHVALLLNTYIVSIGIVLAYVFMAICIHFIVGSTMVSMLITDILIVGLDYMIYCECKKNNPDTNAFDKRFDFDIKRVLCLVSLGVLISYLSITCSLFINSLNPIDIDRSETALWYIILVNVIMAPIAEEILFRLCIYNILKISSHWIVAMFFSSLMFGMFHGTAYHLIMGSLFGMFLVLCYELSGRNMIIPIVIHMLYNIETVVLTETMFFYSSWFVPVISFIIFVLLVIYLSISVHRRKFVNFCK